MEGRQGATSLPYGSMLTGNIDVRQKFRYVRVAKTDGAYFSIADFSVQQGDGALQDATSVPNVNPSTYYTIQNVNSGLLADVSGASTSDGASVVQWQSDGGTNQQWKFVPVTGQLHKIVNRNSGNALNIGNGSHARGTTLEQWTGTAATTSSGTSNRSMADG